MRGIALSAVLASSVACGFFHPALAGDEHNGTSGYTLDETAEHAVIHDGVTFYFASEMTAERFSADPERYMPKSLVA